MYPIENRPPGIEETPFTREQAEGSLDAYFTENPELGQVQLKEYQGYFLDQFKVYFHAFNVTTAGNSTGHNSWGVTVTQEEVGLILNPELYQATLNLALKLDKFFAEN